MTALPRWIAWPSAAVIAATIALTWRPFVSAAEDHGPAASTPISDLGAVSGKATFSAARPKQPIIVYLEREGGEVPADKPPAKVIGQKGAQFSPPFSVVVVGQDVIFKNDEDKEIDHNVYTLGAEQKNFEIFPRGESKTYPFSKPGEVSLYCSVHKLMDGKIFVAPSAAWAEVADDGSFSIDRVATGTYTLRTYQKAKRFRDAEQKITVKAGETASVTVEMKR